MTFWSQIYSRAPVIYHVGCQRMDLHAVLVSHDVAAGRPGVGTDDDAVLEDGATDGGSGLGRLGGGHVAAAHQKCVSGKEQECQPILDPIL